MFPCCASASACRHVVTMASRLPLATALALLALALLALGSGAALAAFGRKAKLKLQRKAKLGSDTLDLVDVNQFLRGVETTNQ